MYRRVDPRKNKRHVGRDEVPEHVRQQVLEQDRAAEEAAAEAAAAAAARQSSVKIRVLLNGGKERTITGDKRRPASELAATAAEAFDVPWEGVVQATSGVHAGGGPSKGVGGGVGQWTKEESDDEDSGGGETDHETHDEGQSDGGSSEVDPYAKAIGEVGLTAAGQATGSEGASRSAAEGRAAGGGALAELPGRKTPERLVRLREYLTAPKLPGVPYDERATLGELSFFQGKTVWLETRRPGQPWQRFDPDDVNIAMVRFERVVKGQGGARKAEGKGGAGASAGPSDPLNPFPVVGKFAPERNMRMKASGTIGEIRGILAAFAGTDEARTRVFTMSMDDAESTYKVLCPPRRRKAVGRRLGSSQEPLASEVEGAGVAVALGGVGAKGVPDADAGLDTLEDGPAPVSSVSGGGEAAGVSSEMSGSGRRGGGGDEEPEEGDWEEESGGVVVLGKAGGTLVHKVYVEEVLEDEEEVAGGEAQSLAVRVATDDANRLSVPSGSCLRCLMLEYVELPRIGNTWVDVSNTARLKPRYCVCSGDIASANCCRSGIRSAWEW